MKNRNSIMPENYEECVSLTLRTRNSKTSRMLARIWKHHWLTAMPCKTCKKSNNLVTRGKSNEIKSKLCVYLWSQWIHKTACGKISTEYHENHVVGAVHTSLQQYIMVHKFIPMLQAMKVPAAKAAVDKEWEKLERIPASDLTRSQK